MQGCKLKTTQILPFIPSNGITMHELKQCFSTTTLPDNAKAMEELEGLVKQVAVEGHGTPGRYYPMKHAKARLDGSYTVMGGTLTSMPTLSGDAYTKTVKIKCPDAFTLQRVCIPSSAGDQVLTMS